MVGRDTMWGFNLCQSHPNLFSTEVISHYAGTPNIHPIKCLRNSTTYGVVLQVLFELSRTRIGWDIDMDKRVCAFETSSWTPWVVVGSAISLTKTNGLGEYHDAVSQDQQSLVITDVFQRLI